MQRSLLLPPRRSKPETPILVRWVNVIFACFEGNGIGEGDIAQFRLLVAKGKLLIAFIEFIYVLSYSIVMPACSFARSSESRRMLSDNRRWVGMSPEGAIERWSLSEVGE